MDFQPGFIFWVRQGLIMLIYKSILDNYTTWTKVNARDFMPFPNKQDVTLKTGYTAAVTV